MAPGAKIQIHLPACFYHRINRAHPANRDPDGRIFYFMECKVGKRAETKNKVLHKELPPPAYYFQHRYTRMDSPIYFLEA